MFVAAIADDTKEATDIPHPRNVIQPVDALLPGLNPDAARGMRPVLVAGTVHYGLVRFHPFVDAVGVSLR